VLREALAPCERREVGDALIDTRVTAERPEVDHECRRAHQHDQHDRREDEHGAALALTLVAGGPTHHCSSFAVALLASVTGTRKNAPLISSVVRTMRTWTR